jgi:hypothetical protein
MQHRIKQKTTSVHFEALHDNTVIASGTSYRKTCPLISETIFTLKNISI